MQAKRIARRFRRTFTSWGIALAPEDVEAGRRGKTVEGGWDVWYLFGEDERGAYFDSHRMTDDRHARVREDGSVEHLPTIDTFRIAPQNPREDSRLGAEYLEHNRRVGRMLRAKGFGVAGDEPLSIRVNRNLRLGRGEEV